MKNSKNNKYADMSLPQAEFDFHGKGVVGPLEVKKFLNEFLDECIAKNLKRILVITGKGIHSKSGEPVVKKLAFDYLRSDNRVGMVLKARRDRGGEGAFEVQLR